MSIRNLIRKVAGALLALLAAFAVQAQTKDCVQLKTAGQKEETYVDAQGKSATRLVELGKVVPGDVVVWTITATNTCSKPADKVVVNNAVPQYMNYLADSAAGTGTEITFTVNGRDFSKWSELVAVDADGKSRPARAEDVKAIRWTYANSLAPGATASVHYRAKLQ